MRGAILNSACLCFSIAKSYTSWRHQLRSTVSANMLLVTYKYRKLFWFHLLFEINTHIILGCPFCLGLFNYILYQRVHILDSYGNSNYVYNVTFSPLFGSFISSLLTSANYSWPL